ncbi:ras guanine nucleotide exchange factor B-like isoform X3 [Anopheles albimanus]|uniref:ras guanine nucleotide exchange factor B-like isoform X3 n=1 Tax=Anopheles albimanus TaxID=7167 RepID=UPI00163EB137|nr:ras guanine nucleotide exchange factor B-like isoform X3 [Anopheles albimanus]
MTRKNAASKQAANQEQSTAPPEVEDVPRGPTYQEIDDGITSRQSLVAMAWLLFYSTAMFTLPFVAFYGTRYSLSHYLQIEDFPNTCASVAAAVFVVNAIIMLYALRGYEDAQEDDRVSRLKAELNAEGEQDHQEQQHQQQQQQQQQQQPQKKKAKSKKAN